MVMQAFTAAVTEPSCMRQRSAQREERGLGADMRAWLARYGEHRAQSHVANPALTFEASRNPTSSVAAPEPLLRSFSHIPLSRANSLLTCPRCAQPVLAPCCCHRVAAAQEHASWYVPNPTWRRAPNRAPSHRASQRTHSPYRLPPTCSSAVVLRHSHSPPLRETSTRGAIRHATIGLTASQLHWLITATSPAPIPFVHAFPSLLWTSSTPIPPKRRPQPANGTLRTAWRPPNTPSEMPACPRR